MGSDHQNSKLNPSIVHITAHNPKTGTSIIHSSEPAFWISGDESKPTYNVSINYSTSRTPAILNSNLDIEDHVAAIASGTAFGCPSLGSSFRMLDFATGYTTSMHRTGTLDYGIVIGGTLELTCDGKVEVGKGVGEIAVLKREDVSVM